MNKKESSKSLYSKYLDYSNKYNPASILLLLYFLGSIVQIYELFKIDIFYVIFFSITQLISDGAILLILLLIIMTIWKLIDTILLILGFWEKVSQNINELSKQHYLYASLLLLGVPLAFLLVFPMLDISIENNPIISLIFVSVLFIFLSICNKSSSIYQKYLQHDKELSKQEKIYADLTLLSPFISFVISILLIILVLRIVLGSSQNPVNFENFNKAKYQVISDYDELDLSVENCEILYFNDKYTFIQVSNSENGNKFIVIYQTESAFFDRKVISVES